MNSKEMLAKNLIKLREWRGLSLSGMAEKSGIAKSTLSNLERGNGNPTVETLWQIANTLNVSFGALVKEVDDEFTYLNSSLIETGASVRLIERDDDDRLVEVYLVEIKRGCKAESQAHPKGIREQITILSGVMLAGDKEKPKLVRTGETYDFKADAPHIYEAQNENTKALVVIFYPPKFLPNREGITVLNWPREEMEWNGIQMAIERLVNDVSNGLPAQLVRFQRCTIDFASACGRLNKHIEDSQNSFVHMPFYLFVNYDELGPYFIVYPFYYTDTFSKELFKLPIEGNLKKAHVLSEIVESINGLKDNQAVLDFLHMNLSHDSWVLSSIAAEALIRAGVCCYPKKLLSLKPINTLKTCVESGNRSFFSRINIEQYDAFELLRPAYVRQVVASATEITKNISVKKQLNSLDIGSGSRIPLIILKELLPQLCIQAVEPDLVAFSRLSKKIENVLGIEPRQCDFLDLDLSSKYAIITCFGVSHYFNTSQMLQKAFLLLEDGGILVVSGDFIAAFTNLEERNKAILLHHGAYILSLIANIDIVYSDKTDFYGAIYQFLKKELLTAIIEAQSSSVQQSVERCGKMYLRIKEELDAGKNSTFMGECMQFFLLELKTMLAGFEYEVERKTYPAQFLNLAKHAGLVLLNHKKVFSSVDNDEWGGGTHVFTFKKNIIDLTKD